MGGNNRCEKDFSFPVNLVPSLFLPGESIRSVGRDANPAWRAEVWWPRRVEEMEVLDLAQIAASWDVASAPAPRLLNVSNRGKSLWARYDGAALEGNRNITDQRMRMLLNVWS